MTPLLFKVTVRLDYSTQTTSSFNYRDSIQELTIATLKAQIRISSEHVNK
nr:MAG TPA: hypothetical protein [Caudoviricetes sp.]